MKCDPHESVIQKNQHPPKEHGSQFVRRSSAGLVQGITAILVVAIILTGPNAIHAQATDRCADGIQQGWHFYCDPEPQEEPAETETVQPRAEPQEKPKTKPEPNKHQMTARERLDAFNKEVEEVKARAIINPTHENLVAYMSIQKEMIDRAENFQKQWTASLYQTPNLDHNTVYPLTNTGVFDFQDQKKAKQLAQLQEAAQTHVIMYVHEGPDACYTCKTQSETVKALVETQSLPVFVVSKDGYRYPEFPDAEIDRGNLKGLGLQDNPTPFIALIEPSTEKVTLLGHGLVTEDQIISRTYRLLNPETIQVEQASTTLAGQPATPNATPQKEVDQ